MRNILVLTIAISGLMCVFSGCSKKDDKAPHIISVVGIGEVKAVPDTIVFSFRIESWDKDLGKSQARNKRIIRRLISVAKTFKIDAKDIETEDASIHPRYETNEKNKREFKGYEASQSVEITLRNKKQYDDFLQSAMKTGVTHLFDVDKKLDNRKKYELKARDLAVKDAQEKAEQLAKKAGVRIGKPVYISESCYGSGENFDRSPGPRDRSLRYAMETEFESTYSPGQESINMCVNIHFELK